MAHFREFPELWIGNNIPYKTEWNTLRIRYNSK
jgi:hypothetical protein